VKRRHRIYADALTVTKETSCMTPLRRLFAPIASALTPTSPPAPRAHVAKQVKDAGRGTKGAHFVVHERGSRPRTPRCAATCVSLALAALALVVPSAQASEAHPLLTEFGSFANPNGIAVDEPTGDVYVADLGASERQTVSLEGGPEGGGFTLEFEGQQTSPLGVSGTTGPSAEEVQSALRELSTIGPAGNEDVSVTEEGALPGTVTYTVTFQGGLAARDVPELLCDGSALSGGTSPACTVATATQGVEAKVYRFDAAGNPLNFSSLGSNELTGAATPTASFSFPSASGNPAAIAVDSSTDPSDPSAGDLYVLDGGHNVVDKFSPAGAYLGQIAGPTSEVLGLGIDAHGALRLDVRPFTGDLVAIDVFDNALTNGFVKFLEPHYGSYGMGMEPERAFAVGSAGDGYALFSCHCIEKFGPNIEELGRLDDGFADVAVAVDQVDGHVYVDEQSSVTEWDAGEMNGKTYNKAGEETSSGVLVSSFGSLQLSSSTGQGGIAVNGATGEVYVSNPADGKVYVFATTPPDPAARQPTDVTKTSATLNGSVDPRGAPITSCSFEYGTTSAYGQSLPCAQSPAQVGSGTSPVPVSADLNGLQPGLLYHFRLQVAGQGGESSSGGLLATAGPGFGIKSFEVQLLNRDGTPDTQAGSHPYQMVTDITFNTHYVRREPGVESRYMLQPDGNVKDLITTLPAGLVGDPNATPARCTLQELDKNHQSGECPPGSMIGNLEVEFGDNYPTLREPVYNMVPPHGVVAQFGAHFIIPNAIIDVSLHPGGDYGVTATVTNSPAIVPVIRTKLTIFGIPPNGEGEQRRALLTMPTACTGPLTSALSADSYADPGHFAGAESLSRNAAGEPAGLTGCSNLRFPPRIDVSPDLSDASSSSGLSVGVNVSQQAAQNPEGLVESNLREATVTLPEGLTLNPSGADGLEGCSEQLAGFTGFVEFNPQFEPGVKTPTFTPQMPEPLQPGTNFCPNSSKVATARIVSPLLPNPLEGDVYLATPYRNPFGSLLALYLIAEDPVSGALIKLPGEVTLDPASGRLVSTFKQTPDLPFEDLTLHFFGGNRAPLVTPALCGEYTTQALFTPWDGNGALDTSSIFDITSGQNGGPCPPGGAPAFHPNLTAGTRSNAAGHYSPLDLELSRGDSEQEFTHFSLKLPPGLSGKLAGIPLCPDAQIAAAKARTGPHGGQEEQESPSCPAASEIGHTLVGAGVGSVLVWVPGQLYLAGPYHGSALSVVSITNAKAGPFDLGTVVVREALKVNPETAEVFVDATGSDPLPHIIAGIPTHLRKILIYLNRPEFTLNPTSCEPMSIASTVLGSGADFTTEADDQPVTVTSPFQAADCAALPFHPKLSLKLLGATKRTAHPRLKATLHMNGIGEAAISRAQVTLPKSEFLDQGHLNNICTRVQFKEGNGNGEKCPPASIYGHARARTPLLAEPLEGPVFLRSSEHQLPDLVAALHGQEINIDLVGRIDSLHGQIRNTFEAVPDAPVESFTLEMQGGAKGLLVNSTSLCRGTHRAIVNFDAHNGKVSDTTPALGAKCSAHRHKGKHRHGRGRRHR
jgi:hypothetical protein